MKLVDFPRPLPMSAYDKSRDFVRKQYAGTDGVLGLVEFGTVGYPGIADVDFIAIVEPKEVHMPSMKEIYKDDSYAPMHKPFVYSKNTYPLMRCIDPWLIHILPILKKEKEFTIEYIKKLTEEEHKWMSLRLVLHWSTTILRLVTTVKSTGAIPCRTFLDNCINVKYCYRELRRIGAVEEDDPNIPFYETMRDGWFDLSPEDQRERIETAFKKIEESDKAMLSLLRDYFEGVAEMKTPPLMPPKTAYQRELLKKYPNSLIVAGKTRVYVFQKDRKDIEMEYETFTPPILTKYGGAYKRYVFVLPLSLSTIYNNYLFGKGALSDHYRNICATDLDNLPFAPTDEAMKFINVTNQIVDETKGVDAIKYLFESFDLQTAKSHPSFGARIGIACYSITNWLAHSFLGKLLGKKTVKSTL